MMDERLPSDIFPSLEELEKVRKLCEDRDANNADANLLVVAALISGKGGPVDRKYVLELLQKASTIPLESILDGTNTRRFIELLEHHDAMPWTHLETALDELATGEATD